MEKIEEGAKRQKKHKVTAFALSAAVGFVNGFFGGGGGMLCVPLLLYVYKLPVKKAHATALLVILPLSIISGIIYSTFGAADVGVLWKAGIGVLAGGIAGAFLLKKLSNDIICAVFAVVMLAAGVKLLFF